MHRTLSGRAVLAAAVLTFSCALVTTWSAGPAEAATGSSSCPSGSGGSSGGGGGGSDGDYKLWARVSKQIPACAGGGMASQTDGTGGVTVHVPCWWGPEYSPQGLADYVNAFAGQGSTDNWYMILKGQYDKNGTDAPSPGYQSTDGPPYQSYNVNISPLGEWYGLIFNSGDTLDQLAACTNEQDSRAPDIFFWGVNGKAPADLPKGAPGFTELDLAKYVESVVDLPPADVTTSPGQGRTATIGLPVWYWQVENTRWTHLARRVCAYNVCVNFTADAVSFTIDPGTGAAHVSSKGCVVYPASKTIGLPYASKYATTTPSCGVEYTAPAARVTPSVETTWHVRISWTGGSWSPPKDPVIPGTLTPIKVQDIQAVNQSTATPTP